MTPTDAIPLLVVVILLLSIGGGDVSQMTVTFEGDHTIEQIDDTIVVAGGTLTVPQQTSVSGDIYVIGGAVRIAGTLDGDVTILAGALSIPDGATVSGTVQSVAGDSSIAPGATVAHVSTVDPPAPTGSRWRRLGGFLIQLLGLGAVGWWLTARHRGLLDTVGDAITGHPLVSGVVGALAATSVLVLCVYMAFTIILLPVSLVGLLAELLIVLYAQVVFGYLIGTRLPIDRPPRATVAGIALLLVGVEALGIVPYLGGLVQLGLLAVGIGAILNTYFGLQRFDPVVIPGGVE